MISPKKLKFLLLVTILINLQACAYFKKDSDPGAEKDNEVKKLIKKKRPNPDLKQRAEKNEGTLFNTNRLKNNNTNFEFSTSNPLWRATLNSFEGIPLQTVSYSGGVIVTDWWSKKGSSESIKIQVSFQSNELRASSLKVSSFKKKCDKNMNCKVANLSQNFNEKIKNNIFDQAKRLKIEDEERKIKN